MQPVARSIAYLVLLALEHLPADALTEIIEQYIYRGRKDEWPMEAREVLLMPIADQLRSEMEDICTADCDRLFGRPRVTLLEEKDEIDTYWRRFDPQGMPEKGRQAHVWLERSDGLCKVGFKTDADHDCPLVHFAPTPDNLLDLLTIVKKVAAFRKAQAESKRREEERARKR
jgi:hypothetical protein